MLQAFCQKRCVCCEYLGILLNLLALFSGVSLFCSNFALLEMSIRIVAQLVAHYVRDVGVGRSSRLYPT